ncbi:3-oxoadipate enol-lactonase [Rhodobacteraceae bacterium W635]|uniref:3-oxoadipate enol-lactonase n=1 Tax=Nioella halotolerans TaxID=2303578 RepID=UPI000E3C7EA5|nr:3-oxoadipate enol-lactonase [Rhodobacteraceae bacterium W635]
MARIDLGHVALNVAESGEPGGAPVVFAGALGTELAIWDAVVAALPAGIRAIRYDLRGHGQSDCPAGPYAMGALVRDAEALLDALSIRDAVFVGLSVGGLVAQGLAVKRMDLVRGLVLSGTAPKIGTKAGWQARAAMVRAEGPAAISDTVMWRWFSRRVRDGGGDKWLRNMLERQAPEGYAATCEAIAGTDFLTPTSGLRLPALVTVGTEDRTTPPDLVRDLADLIPGSRFALLRGAGHLPCVDSPALFADTLTGFLDSIGYGDAT